MKIFAIQENEINRIGFLFYYEKKKVFYIELLNNLDEWDVPLLLSSLYKKGTRSIDDYYSRTWVCNRIVPTDRQNIGQILRDNKLKVYDEYSLLVLANGKCEQDNYYITPITMEELPTEIKNRFAHRIENILILEGQKIIVFFRNGMAKECDMESIKADYRTAQIMVDGFGLSFDNGLEIPCSNLFVIGKTAKLSLDILHQYIKENVLTTAEVMAELNCTRQYVNELVKSGTISPIKSSAKATLFLKSSIL